VALAGGGLANSLLAWQLATRRPGLELLLLERGATLGGNHTWSFHGGDLTTTQQRWIAPLVAHRWPGQVVRFPAFERRLDTSYHSVTATQLHAVVSAALGSRVRFGQQIAQVTPQRITLADGTAYEADLVVDGRGVPPLEGFSLAWQKFVGLELELGSAHGLSEPVLMDATVEQLDGYRFVYVLPLGPRRLLVEDTYYSDSPELVVPAIRQRVRDYVVARGWQLAAVLREETGCLPIVRDGDPAAWWAAADDGVPRSGMRALLFNHTTGYSLPEAVRLAEAIAAEPQLDSSRIATLVRDHSLRRWREQRMFRLLNRLMFEAAEPAARYRTLQHFYGLPEPLIRRFYAGELRGADGLRLLLGRPPVPVARALGTILRGLWPARPRPALEGRGQRA
jgi:lycopene beta-cyclase